jgi:hypothetical protein
MPLTFRVGVLEMAGVLASTTPTPNTKELARPGAC